MQCTLIIVLQGSSFLNKVATPSRFPVKTAAPSEEKAFTPLRSSFRFCSIRFFKDEKIACALAEVVLDSSSKSGVDKLGLCHTFFYLKILYECYQLLNVGNVGIFVRKNTERTRLFSQFLLLVLRTVVTSSHVA